MIPRRRAYTYPGEMEDIERWAKALAARDDADSSVIAEWEAAVARYIGMPSTVALNAGRRGLLYVLEHLNTRGGDEVVIPAFTLGDLVGLIETTGARAVPADIDPETFNVTAESISARCTPRTKAILVLHAFGNPCPVDEIVAWAEPRGIPVIEDCAHSMGAALRATALLQGATSLRRAATGTFGYAAFFSGEVGKPVTTFGGGILTSRDETLLAEVRAKLADDVVDVRPMLAKVQAFRIEQRILKSRWSAPLLYILNRRGGRSALIRSYRSRQRVLPSHLRFTSLQARLGLTKLPNLDERLRLRRERVRLLASLLSPAIRVQRVLAGNESTWYSFVAVLPCPAARVRKRLLWRQIDAAVEEEVIDHCGRMLKDTACPHADSIFERAIALPMFDGISEADIAHVAQHVNAALE